MKILTDAEVTQSVLLVLYLLTYIRMKLKVALKFVTVLIYLLATSCLTWIIACYYDYEFA